MFLLFKKSLPVSVVTMLCN